MMSRQSPFGYQFPPADDDFPTGPPPEPPGRPALSEQEVHEVTSLFNGEPYSLHFTEYWQDVPQGDLPSADYSLIAPSLSSGLPPGLGLSLPAQTVYNADTNLTPPLPPPFIPNGFMSTTDRPSAASAWISPPDTAAGPPGPHYYHIDTRRHTIPNHRHQPPTGSGFGPQLHSPPDAPQPGRMGSYSHISRAGSLPHGLDYPPHSPATSSPTHYEPLDYHMTGMHAFAAPPGGFRGAPHAGYAPTRAAEIDQTLSNILFPSHDRSLGDEQSLQPVPVNFGSDSSFGGSEYVPLSQRETTARLENQRTEYLACLQADLSPAATRLPTTNGPQNTTPSPTQPASSPGEKEAALCRSAQKRSRTKLGEESNLTKAGQEGKTDPGPVKSSVRSSSAAKPAAKRRKSSPSGGSEPRRLTKNKRGGDRGFRGHDRATSATVTAAAAVEPATDGSKGKESECLYDANGKLLHDAKARKGREPLYDANGRLMYDTKGKRHVRPLLSEDQKRENHIKSEQKRRAVITMGFEDMSNLVPNLPKGLMSRSTLLNLTCDWLEELTRRNKETNAREHPP